MCLSEKNDKTHTHTAHFSTFVKGNILGIVNKTSSFSLHVTGTQRICHLTWLNAPHCSEVEKENVLMHRFV